MQLQKELINLLQLAHSAEKAAAYAYQGHAGSVNDAGIKKTIKVIEEDEWEHRAEVLKIMNGYNIPVSKWYEFKYAFIGRLISSSCYVIGWFMPMYFAGRLESGNVNEYFIMKDLFNALNIYDHDAILTEMGLKEKEHEVFFLGQIRQHKLLPVFEKIFNWGANKSFNTIPEEIENPV
ncbi:MAG: hypothetical protein JWN78_1845 [Bacteroidota bacterium]|nr:hypothetical protein [Bacteroidota bacterium]